MSDNLKDFTVPQKDIVKFINGFLDRKTWTELEMKHGRIIHVQEEWKGIMKDVILEYKKAGWIITRRVELCSINPGYPRNYLLFKHPLHLNLID